MGLFNKLHSVGGFVDVLKCIEVKFTYIRHDKKQW